jgi:hypothetical protein
MKFSSYKYPIQYSNVRVPGAKIPRYDELNIFDRIFSKDAKTHDIECNILTNTKVISSCP